jgi:hypothetical protein
VDTAIIACVAVVIAIALFALLVPLRLIVNAQGRGDPSGAWAVAAGGQLGPLVASGVGARGVTPRVELRLFGRKVWSKSLNELAGAGEESAEKPGKKLDRARASYARVERWFDPADLGLWLLEERRRVRIDRMVLKLRYSFQDVALTGKMLGAIYVLSGILPPPLELRQEVSWDSEDRASAVLDGQIKVWPGLILVDSALFMLRNVRLRKRANSPDPEGERQST